MVKISAKLRRGYHWETSLLPVTSIKHTENHIMIISVLIKVCGSLSNMFTAQQPMLALICVPLRSQTNTWQIQIERSSYFLLKIAFLSQKSILTQSFFQHFPFFFFFFVFTFNTVTAFLVLTSLMFNFAQQQLFESPGARLQNLSCISQVSLPESPKALPQNKRNKAIEAETGGRGETQLMHYRVLP